MYRALAKMYGWTFAYIASLTTAQQFAALDVEENTKIDSKGREVISFRDEHEAQAWIAAQQRTK